MSATEIGQIGSSLLLTYYGGQGHRPKWIAWGMILFAVSSFTCSMPHFIYGEQLIRQNEKQFSAVGPDGQGGGPNFTDPIPANLCKFYDQPENITGLNGYDNAILFILNLNLLFRYSTFLVLFILLHKVIREPAFDKNPCSNEPIKNEHCAIVIDKKINAISEEKICSDKD